MMIPPYRRCACSVFLSIALTGCSEAPATNVERGRRLLSQYHCGTCHVIPGVNGANGTFAVPLESFGLRSYIAGHIPNSEEHLVRWVMEPASLIPGTLMPNMGVTPADARDIAAYLLQLR